MTDQEILGAAIAYTDKHGGGGGTTNYNDLSNQPQINGNTLTGNKSASDLGLQREVLFGATNPTGGEDGDLYLKTISASNADVFGTPTANTGDGYEITTDVTAYSDYLPFEAFGNGIGFGRNSAGRATLIYHVTSGKKYKPKSISLCNNFDVVGGYLTSNSTVVSGSIDGTNWSQLATIATLTDKDESITEQISTNVFYSYFKFEILANTGYPGIKNIVLVGESDSEEDNKIDNIFFKQDGKWLKDAFAQKSEVETALSGKQNTLTFDSVPTDGSTNPVESNGVYDALATKANTTDVTTALATKQDATDNTLETTDKTVSGAINEVNSGVETLQDWTSADTKTVTGNPITLTDAAALKAKALSMTIVPDQDLHGFDHPWPAGGGKNKYPKSIMEISASGFHSKNFTAKVSPNTSYVISISRASADTQFNYAYMLSDESYAGDTLLLGTSETSTTYVLTTPNDAIGINIYSTSSTTSVETFIQVEEGNQATPWSPYENICPISGLTSAEVETTDGETTHTATITFGQTVYSGNVVFETGNVVVTDACIDMGDFEWNDAGATGYTTSTTSISGAVNPTYNYYKADMTSERYLVLPFYRDGVPGHDSNSTDGTFAIQASNNNVMYVRDLNLANMTGADVKAALTGSKIRYKLATPTELTLTPAQLELLKGHNTITANGATISLTYQPDNLVGEVMEQVNDKVDGAKTYTDTKVAAILPTYPTTDGAYVLTATVSGGETVLSWESAT